VRELGKPGDLEQLGLAGDRGAGGGDLVEDLGKVSGGGAGGEGGT
jgi:hypothetical protein